MANYSMEEERVEDFLSEVNTEQIENQKAAYEEQLRAIRSQLSSMLLDFRKYYVFYKKNPENQEYQRAYQNVQANLTNLGSKLFQLNNEVETNIRSINDALLALDISISSEKDDNSELKRKIQQVYANSNAASERIDDYQEIYDKDYLRNWALALSIGVAIYTSTLFYQKSTSV
jgi:predicted  nucleic acid-binding Zn-ribbon protein